MKTELIPKHTQKVGDNFVVWFESSNSYVVISPDLHFLLTRYFESKDKDDFLQELQMSSNISTKEAKAYYTELSVFLEDITTAPQAQEHTLPFNAIPNPNISKVYAFGDINIQINYASEKVLQLIHPYLHHALADSLVSTNAVFDIFNDDGLLYLFKNKSFIGSYETTNFHFLQGKFAMELVTSIYNNSESDWLATFHASTVCNDKEAIMIIGDSGNGKSTLSAVLMAHGFDLLADDFTPMLAENQHVYRFPAAISIKKGAFNVIETLFDDFRVIEPQISSSKHTVVKYLPPSTPFKSSHKHFECHKLVMVKYSSDAESQLRECPPEKFLQTFIPDSWISPQPNHSKQFLNWLKDLKFYELTYNYNDFAVAKFKELFDM